MMRPWELLELQHVFDIVTSIPVGVDASLNVDVYQYTEREGSIIIHILCNPCLHRIFYTFKRVWISYDSPDFNTYRTWHPELQCDLEYLIDIVRCPPTIV